MTVEAHIESDYVGEGLKVVVLRKNAGTAALIQVGSNNRLDMWKHIDDAVESPFIWITEDTGRALLEALLEHYNGSQDTRQLRKDYDHERARVDKLINYAIGK